MHTQPYLSHGKKPANLSISADLLEQAKLLRINLSKTLEERLRELIKKKQAEQWRHENKRAIEEYNSRIEKEGLFSDDFRRI